MFKFRNLTPIQLLVYALSTYGGVDDWEFKRFDLCTLIRKCIRTLIGIAGYMAIGVGIGLSILLVIATNWFFVVMNFDFETLSSINSLFGAIFIFEAFGLFIAVLMFLFKLVNMTINTGFNFMEDSVEHFKKYRRPKNPDEKYLSDVIRDCYKSVKGKYCIKINLEKVYKSIKS